MTWPKRAAPILSIIALVWCVGVGVYIWVTPLSYARHSSDGASFRMQLPFAQVSALGPVPLLVPAGLTLVAVWAAWTGRLGVLVGTALTLAGFSLLAGFSIGGAYLPAAVVVGIAVAVAAYEDVRRLGRE